MNRTTLLTALALTAVIGATSPAEARRDPGPGSSPSRSNGMALYNYRSPKPPTPPRIGQAGLNNQYSDGMNLYQYVRSNPVVRRDSTGLESIYVYDRRSGQQNASDGVHWRFQWADGCGKCTDEEKTRIKDHLWHAIHKIVYATKDVVHAANRSDFRDSAAYGRLRNFRLITPGATKQETQRQMVRAGKELTRFTKNLFANDNISIACDRKKYFRGDDGQPICRDNTVMVTYSGDGSRKTTRGGRYRHKLFLCPPALRWIKGGQDLASIKMLIHELSHRYMTAGDNDGKGGARYIHIDAKRLDGVVPKDPSDYDMRAAIRWPGARTNERVPASQIGLGPGWGHYQHQQHADSVSWTALQWGS